MSAWNFAHESLHNQSALPVTSSWICVANEVDNLQLVEIKELFVSSKTVCDVQET
jgi:hypothetical protein